MNPDARVDGRAGDTSHRGLDFHPAQVVSWVFTDPSPGPVPDLPQFSTKQGLPGIFLVCWGLVSPVQGNFQEGVFLEECTFLQGVERI